MKQTALFACLVVPALAAAPHYLATTAAGFIPTGKNPVALKQYLDSPQALAYDGHGNLYYATSTQVWRLNSDGTDTLIAGAPGSAATPTSTDKAVNTALGAVHALAFDAQQNLYIEADHYVFKVTPQGVISIFAGTGAGNGSLQAPATGPNVPATKVPFTSVAMTIDVTGNVYVADQVYLAVVEFSPDGSGSGVVGQPLRGAVNAMAFYGTTLYAETGGQLYSSIPPATLAPASIPASGGFAVGPDGLIYISKGSTVQRLDPTLSNPPQTVVGTGAFGSTGDGNLATQATLENPNILAVNPVTRDLAIFDTGAHLVRVVNAVTGVIQTVAGTALYGGDNGPAMLALFNQAGGVVLDASVNGTGNLWLTDVQNRRIRKITPAGIVSTVAGTGVSGTGACDGKANQTPIRPAGPVALDKTGSLYFVNGSGSSTTICRMDPNGNNTTIAGGGTAQIANGVQGTAVSLSTGNLAVDALGDVYFDQGFQLFRLTPRGLITLVAGTGQKGDGADGSAALTSSFGAISSIAVDSAGLVYFGDRDNYRVWKIDSQGMLALVAGSGKGALDLTQPVAAGPAKQTQIGAPAGVTIDAAGNVYFAIAIGFQQIAMVDSSGTLTPVAGGNPVANAASTGDGGDALSAGFTAINGMTMDAAGDLYISDGGSYIRKMIVYDPNHPPPFVAAGGVVGAGGSFPAVQVVSAGGQVTVYGANFIAAGTHHDLQSSDLVNGKIPTVMAGVCVNFGSLPAAMLNVYPGQINLQVGTLPLLGATVQVTVNCGTPNAVTSNIGGVAVQLASPEFYSFLPDPVAGHNPVAAITLPTGTYVGSPGLLPGATFVPVKVGDLVEAYGTGWGNTTPAFGLGVIPGSAGPLTSPYSLTLGGTPVPQANVAYAGISPRCAGFYQVDFTVPAGTASGDQSLVITVAGQASPAGAFVTVK